MAGPSFPAKTESTFSGSRRMWIRSKRMSSIMVSLGLHKTSSTTMLITTHSIRVSPAKSWSLWLDGMSRILQADLSFCTMIRSSCVSMTSGPSKRRFSHANDKETHSASLAPGEETVLRIRSSQYRLLPEPEVAEPASTQAPAESSLRGVRETWNAAPG